MMKPPGEMPLKSLVGKDRNWVGHRSREVRRKERMKRQKDCPEVNDQVVKVK